MKTLAAIGNTFLLWFVLDTTTIASSTILSCLFNSKKSKSKRNFLFEGLLVGGAVTVAVAYCLFKETKKIQKKVKIPHHSSSVMMLSNDLSFDRKKLIETVGKHTGKTNNTIKELMKQSRQR